MNELKLGGIIPAVLTPYDNNHQLDEKTLRDYINFLIDAGVHALFIAGTNGEGPALKSYEKKQVLRVIVDEAAHRLPVVAQTGEINTEETIELTEYAAGVGVDGVAIVAPWYFPHDEESLFQHFSSVAECVPELPFFIYNLPGNTQNDIKPSLVKKLANQYSNIQGVKDSSKDLNRLCDYIGMMGSDFTVVIGTDSLVVPALLMGATGVVSAVADVFPEIMVSMYDAFRAGDYKEAVRLQYLVIGLRDAMKTGPYVTPYKAALSLRGVNFGGFKPPFRLPSHEEIQKMKAKLEILGVLK